MESNAPKCKITVIKRTLNQDLIDEYLDDSCKDLNKCEIFSDGQEFTIENHNELAQAPKGFCHWAWADIRKEISMVYSGADFPGLRDKGVMIAGCTDWFRPVVFKLERID